MVLHRNAKLGLSGRFALVQARERGLPVREVARRFGARRRRSVVGHAPCAQRTRSSVTRLSACSTVRAGRGGCRGCWPVRSATTSHHSCTPARMGTRLFLCEGE